MFITKKSLPRRTFLRGMGVTLGLPLLESMVPAATATAKTAANPQKRFAAIYVPHGVIMEQWVPATAGSRMARSLGRSDSMTFMRHWPDSSSAQIPKSVPG